VVWILGEGEQGGLLDEDEYEAFEDDEEVIDGQIGGSEDGELELDEEDVDEEGENALLDHSEGVNMPGAWDEPPSHPHQHVGRNVGGARAASLPGLGPHSKTNAFAHNDTKKKKVGGAHRHPAPGAGSTISESTNAGAHQNQNANLDNYIILRALDTEGLQKRVAEKQKELEQARKEMDKVEKLWTRKSKDVGRWREGLGVKG